MHESEGTSNADDAIQHQVGHNDGSILHNVIVVLGEVAVLIFRWIFFTIESICRAIMPTEEIDVAGQIVLITGTGHGIGKEIAIQYAQLGSTIVGIDINEAGNLETMKEIRERGGKAYSYICDVTDRCKIMELASQIKADIGTVTILVNNAGIMPTRPLLQQSEREIKKTFDINVFAHFWLIQAFLPDMVQNNRGHIVALSSIAGLTGLKNIVPYCGSKFAVRGYMEALAEELRNESQVKFTVIYPYMVDTGLCKNPHVRFDFMKLLKPNEVAAAIIQAQRRGIQECSVPKYVTYVEKITRLFPKRCGEELATFLDSGVYADT